MRGRWETEGVGGGGGWMNEEVGGGGAMKE